MQNCLVDNGQEMISSSLLYSRDKVHFPKVIIIKYFSTMRHDVTQWLKIMVKSHIIKKFEFSVLNSNFWFYSPLYSNKGEFLQFLGVKIQERHFLGIFKLDVASLSLHARMPRFSYSNCFEIRWNLELFKKRLKLYAKIIFEFSRYYQFWRENSQY